MKKLDEYKEIIHKCSKCGLCQSVCPAYQTTGNECAVSRGQFIMLRGVINGDLKMNKNINKYLDTCLKCGKCSDFCPSEIDIVEVILSAKAEYFKQSFEGKIMSILQSKLIFNTALNLVKNLLGRKKKFNKKFEKKAIYFGGCVEAINPKTSDYAKELLNTMQIQPLNVDFNCCGLPFLSAGNTTLFEEQMKENLEKIRNLDFDYIVTDCASCEWTWKQYIKYADDEIKKKFEHIQFKTIYGLIEENNILFEAKKPCSVTYHTPCHGGVENIITRIKNIEYKELEDKNECCGFAGLTKQTQTSKQLMTSKKENITKTNADYILTNCVGCVISLNYILKFKKRVFRVIDFLRKKCKIVK